MAAPADAGAAAAYAGASAGAALAPACSITNTDQTSIHLVLRFLVPGDCLRLAATSRRLRVDVAADGQINGGLWRRGLVSLNSNNARAAGVIKDGEPLPPIPIANATSLWDHIPIRLVLRRRHGRNAPPAASLCLQESHVGVITTDILHMTTLRGLDMRDLAHMSSARDVLEQLRDRPLAGQSGPRLEELLLPLVGNGHNNALNIFTAVRGLPHLRSFTCTNPRIVPAFNGHHGIIIPSPIAHLHAINADGENLCELHALHLISLRLEAPRRLPRLFGIGVDGHGLLAIFQQLTELHLAEFDADALFPADEHGGPPLPAAEYWSLIWPSLPHLTELSLVRVRHIDTLLESLLPMDAPAPVPCPDLREILIDHGGGFYSPSPAMTNSMPARRINPLRPQHVRIVDIIN